MGFLDAGVHAFAFLVTRPPIVGLVCRATSIFEQSLGNPTSHGVKEDPRSHGGVIITTG